MKRLIVMTLFLLGVNAGLIAQDDGIKWSLQDCIDHAVENNITIKEAALDKAGAEVDYEESKMSRLPNLSGSVSQSLTSGSSIDPITSDFVSHNIYATSLGLNSSVTLFQGNQINNQIKRSRLLVDGNSFYMEEAKNNVILSITEAYLQALYNKESIVIAENTLASAEKEEARAKARYDAGDIAIKDYTDAQSQSASFRYDFIAAKNNYAQQVLTLKQLLELGPEVDFDIETKEVEAVPSLVPDKIEVYTTALEKMPEIGGSKNDVEVAEKSLDIAKGAYLPTLSLTGGLGSGYTNTQDLNFYDQLDVNFYKRVGLSLSIPIFQRYSTKAQVANAKIDIEKAKLSLNTKEKELYKKVETAWLNAIAYQEQLEALRVARDAAQKSYELAQKQYELGGLSTVDLVVSQNTYVNATQKYTQTKYLRLLYSQLLEFYQGNDIKI